MTKFVLIKRLYFFIFKIDGHVKHLNNFVNTF